MRFRTLLTFFVAVLCLALSAPAEAKPHHKHHRHHTSRSHHAKLKTPAHTDVRTAQTHLIHLGYLTGKADGKLGPKTKAALMKFQKDQNLPINGKLTTDTYNALVLADAAMTKPHDLTPPPVASDYMAKHPDFYGHTNQQYSDPMVTAPSVLNNSGMILKRVQSIPTRYAKIETTEDMVDNQRRYSVTLNDQPVLDTDNQPSVIGISETYNLGAEDAIIFTTYSNTSSICPFKHYLMTLNQDGNNLQEIDNCTRGYKGYTKDGSLFITFPESDDARAIGNTWRYENGHLDRL